MFQCTESIGINRVNITNIKTCANGPEGFQLMMLNEQETAHKTKGLVYDPTIVFDDVSS